MRVNQALFLTCTLSAWRVQLQAAVRLQAAKAAIAAMALLLCCSCGAVSLAGTESLLVAPRLNKQQEEVAKAFESAISLRSVVYKPPQSGDFRSPFIFYDIDGDGLDEAIVFYAFSGSDEESGAARATVLKQSANGAWRLLSDVASPTQSPDIEFVKFEKLLSSQSACVVIGWKSVAVNRASTIAMYSIKNNAFLLEASTEYLCYLTEDFDRDGLSELAVVAGGNERGRFKLGLWRNRDGHFEEVDSMELASEVGMPVSMISGNLWDGYRGIYIDERLSGNVATFATEIVRAGPQGLVLLAGGEAVLRDMPESLVRSNYESTFRDDDVLCMDIDSDGAVEVPYSETLPGPTDFSDIEAPRLIHFMRLSGKDFEAAHSAVINKQAGYFVYFPAKWVGAVMVEIGRENGEWHFRKWNSDTQSAAEELLRIRAVSKTSGLDVFEGDYVELAVKGTTVYSAYILKLENEPLSVNEQEVRAIFNLIAE